ncbi:MAG TPA: hypothetical protein VGN26_18230 [Armatimonadota bacterium]
MLQPPIKAQPPPLPEDLAPAPSPGGAQAPTTRLSRRPSLRAPLAMLCLICLGYGLRLGAGYLDSQEAIQAVYKQIADIKAGHGRLPASPRAGRRVPGWRRDSFRRMVEEGYQRLATARDVRVDRVVCSGESADVRLRVSSLDGSPGVFRCVLRKEEGAWRVHWMLQIRRPPGFWGGVQADRHIPILLPRGRWWSPEGPTPRLVSAGMSPQPMSRPGPHRMPPLPHPASP